MSKSLNDDTARLIQERIAANVRAEIARDGRSQTIVGDLIGLHPNSFRDRLAGKIAFTAHEIVRLAALLRVSPASLIEVDTPAPVSRPRGSDPGVLGAEVLPGG
jgi:hypothetical protein